MKSHRNTHLQKISADMLKKLFGGAVFGVGILGAIVATMAFQWPTGGDTNPSNPGYTSANSWISTMLTAIKTKTDASFCDPNSGKYCNIKPTCDGTEASVTVDASKGTGYCIEKAERVAALWESAKMTCEGLGKRLPEPFEWKYGCKNAAGLGLANMIGNWEWASSTVQPIWNSATSQAGVAVPIFGTSGGCADASFGWIGHSSTAESSYAFRCVR